MEAQLRHSAGFWRSVAGVAMVLGIIGSVLIAVDVARGPFGGEFNGGVCVFILLASLLGLLLTLGFFFMVARLMDGVAELISLSRPTQGLDRNQFAGPFRRAGQA